MITERLRLEAGLMDTRETLRFVNELLIRSAHRVPDKIARDLLAQANTIAAVFEGIQSTDGVGR